MVTMQIIATDYYEKLPTMQEWNHNASVAGFREYVSRA